MPTRTERVAATPGFVADPESMDHNTGRQIDWSEVSELFQETPGTPEHTVTTTAAAAIGATTIAVEALDYAIPSGTILDFTGPGEFALLTADAAAGATSLTVEALDADIESGDTATAPAIAGEGDKVIPAGTSMAVIAGSEKIAPRIDRDISAEATETAIGLLASSAIEGEKHAALTGYGIYVGGVVYEELLPDDGDAEWEDGTIPAELQAAGTGFVFETYADDRVT